MFAVSQIIARNLHRKEACNQALWINPEKDDCWREVESICPSLKLLSQDYGVTDYLKRSSAEIEFSAFPEAGDTKNQWIILNLPRQKALLEMMLECAASLLAEDGLLWLAGENKAGIKSADRRLKKYFGRVRKLDSARHCTLFEASEPLAGQTFDPASYREEWLLDCQPTPIRVASYPGVFAHGRVDAGTALLLDVLTDMPIEGEVLDFACGAGLIGTCIAAGHEHARVTLLDTSALALKAVEDTLASNRLEGFVLASDGLSELRGSFDLIVSNPPIHAGVKTDSRLSMRLLDSVHDHLNPGGRLLMVANVHLPYENWLSQRFKHFSELATNNNYKVLLANK
jgi:16S rRNA (guanine1207-N2)-methyltransferase